MENHSYIGVPLSSLRVDTTTRFNMYLKSSHEAPHVLYREKNLSFTETERSRLLENNVKEVYINSDEEDEYRQYIEDNLSAILTDEHLDREEKCEILYGSAQHLMQKVMAEPGAGGVLTRSKHLADDTLGFMIKDPSVFQNIVKVMSTDYYTYTHSINVLVFSVALLQALDVDDPAVIRQFSYGALFHDVGKSMIDPTILNQKGPLTKDQWKLIKLHPVYGCDILKGQGGFEEITFDVTRHHHEKLNGDGYPDNLEGDEVSRLTRVVTICDIFDALTTNRSYKNAVGSFEALNLMKEEMSSQLDPNYFRTFVGLLGSPSL